MVGIMPTCWFCTTKCVGTVGICGVCFIERMKGFSEEAKRNYLRESITNRVNVFEGSGGKEHCFWKVR